MNKETESMPFHESIVLAIDWANTSDLITLSSLIKLTKIPSNHDDIINAWVAKMEVISPANDYGVPASLLAQKEASKPVDWKKIMNSASNLDTAIAVGFDVLPLGIKFIGPKGKILITRNSLPKGDKYVAEICVESQEQKDGRIIFNAGWGDQKAIYDLRAYWGDKIEDWNNKW